VDNRARHAINKGVEDIIELSMSCRHAGCSHTQESDCAVLAAITQRELSEERYSNYMKLRKESEHYEMSYLEKRKKDRAFGRFVKTAKKNMKK
jgi:ribosome biogenesis GTPase